MTELLPLRRRLLYAVRPHLKSLVIAAVSVFGLSLLLIVARSFEGTDGLASALWLTSMTFSVIICAGLVSDEMSTGVMQLWLQRPIDPMGHYLRRLAEALLACALLVTLLVLAARLAAAGAGWDEPDKVLTILPRLLLEMGAVACVAFAASAWLQRGAAIVAAASILGGLVIENTLAVRGEILGPVWNPAVRAFLHPDTAFRDVAKFTGGEADDIVLPVARILAYAAVWVVVGAVGAARGVRNGGVARAQVE